MGRNSHHQDLVVLTLGQMAAAPSVDEAERWTHMRCLYADTLQTRLRWAIGSNAARPIPPSYAWPDHWSQAPVPNPSLSWYTPRTSRGRLVRMAYDVWVMANPHRRSAVDEVQADRALLLPNTDFLVSPEDLLQLIVVLDERQEWTADVRPSDNGGAHCLCWPLSETQPLPPDQDPTNQVLFPRLWRMVFSLRWHAGVPYLDTLRGVALAPFCYAREFLCDLVLLCQQQTVGRPRHRHRVIWSTDDEQADDWRHRPFVDRQRPRPAHRWTAASDEPWLGRELKRMRLMRRRVHNKWRRQQERGRLVSPSSPPAAVDR